MEKLEVMESEKAEAMEVTMGELELEMGNEVGMEERLVESVSEKVEGKVVVGNVSVVE